MIPCQFRSNFGPLCFCDFSWFCKLSYFYCQLSFVNPNCNQSTHLQQSISPQEETLVPLFCWLLTFSLPKYSIACPLRRRSKVKLTSVLSVSPLISTGRSNVLSGFPSFFYPFFPLGGVRGEEIFDYSRGLEMLAILHNKFQ